jgi:hypothetical protein
MNRLRLLLPLAACLACGTSALFADTDDPPNWAARIDIADEALFSPADILSERTWTTLRWIKFTWLPGAETDLYFQNSATYPFHYPFAAAHIPEFAGYSPDEYNDATLYDAGRVAFAGAVLVVEGPSPQFGHSTARMVALQISGLEPLPRETVADVFGRLRASLTLPEGMPLDYLPTYEQIGAAGADADWLAERGIAVRSMLEWTASDAVYSEGWAIGRLVRCQAEQLEQAYLDGELLPTDILMIDAVPAEVPFVAGIITEFPATPNSHVAILAESWEIPFIHSSGAAAFHGMIGQTVSLRASGGSFRIGRENLDANPALYEEIMTLKRIPQLQIQPMQADIGILSLPVDDLVPDDIDLVGGKAAHFGLLRRAIPDNSPEAIAFTFDLWNAFMEQPLAGAGHPLRDEIAERLAPFDAYPPDFRSLQAALAGIRDLIRNDADFTAAHKAAIIEALAPFDPARKIRFRSSTNVEDSEFFTGAGLYDSYSGCLLDDLDGDGAGPSACDPEQSSERGVFRAMRRVFASFYNDNAYLERLRHGVDEAGVGMAILVHHSYPDPIELANGVSVYRPRPGVGAPRVEIVTQKGAVSVTNPVGGAIPEVVTATLYQNFGPYYHVQQASNLLILGEPGVMEWDADYHELGDLMVAVAEEWLQARPGLDDRPLEFEFKKLAPDGRLEVKQVRPLPPAAANAQRHFLLPGTVRLQTFQGSQSDAVSLHRAKADLRLHTAGTEVSAATLASLYSDAEYTHAGAGEIETWEGAPSGWPGAAFASFQEADGLRLVFRDSWSQRAGGTAATRRLEARIILDTDIPIHFLGDLEYQFLTDYAEPPLPAPLGGWIMIGGPDEPQPPYTEYARLTRTLATNPPNPSMRLVERSADYAGVAITTGLYWPPHPVGPTAGYTAPLAAWERTTITGLTSEPLVLTGYFSRTYCPGHHNNGDSFVFEPHLDPGVPEYLKAELDRMGIRTIFSGRPGILYASADGEFGYPATRWRYQHGGEGWLWTRDDLYPIHYSPVRRTWLHFIPESAAASTRWWFDYTDGGFLRSR